MRLIKTVAWALALTAFVGLGSVTQGLAAYGSPGLLQDRAAAPEPAAITGELVRVSLEQKTFAVKSAGGAEMMFGFNDQTIVSGGENSVAGLATSSGAQVTVSYKNEGGTKMASKIEVQPKR
jgi:hypothetical protein